MKTIQWGYFSGPVLVYKSAEEQSFMFKMDTPSLASISRYITLHEKMLYIRYTFSLSMTCTPVYAYVRGFAYY